jgi:serine/threonine protein kinase
VPEAPAWLSAEAKHFLSLCFARDARDRCTAAQLLEHPFLASAGCGVKPADEVATKWVSPKSTLDAALWEESDAEDEDVSESSPAERIRALASTTCSPFPEWDSDDEGWIDVLNESSEEASDAATEKAGEDDECVPTAEASETALDFSDAYVEDSDREPTVGLTALLVEQREELCSGFFSDPPVFFVSTFCENEITESLLRQSSSPQIPFPGD